MRCEITAAVLKTPRWYLSVIIGAVNGWNTNGQKNGWPTANASQATTFDDIFNLGIRTPGYVHVPVCDAETA